MHEAKHVDTESVLNLVSLELEPSAVDVAQVDPAIGHHAIDVECDELDGSRQR
jgi:hypothetical protein